MIEPRLRCSSSRWSTPPWPRTWAGPATSRAGRSSRPTPRRTGAIVARESGTIAGTDAAAALAFRLLDPMLGVKVHRPDGRTVEAGDVVMRIDGSARSVLGAERVALNLLCHLSASPRPPPSWCRRPGPIVCTIMAKTTPNWAPQQLGGGAGGGVNHRFGLDDGVPIRDNHIAVAGGVREAIARVKRSVGHMVKIEVEVEDLVQLREALAAGVDVIMLDNMTPEQLRVAVQEIDGRAVTEASGRITPETVQAVAASGVDLISVGWITHSAPILDLGLDVE